VTYNIAVAGAGGAVGRTLVRVLEERDFPVSRLVLLATSRTAGTGVDFRGEKLAIEPVRPEAFVGIDLAFFATPTEVSRGLVPEAVRQGAVVVDKSSAYREDPEVPLVVPEVNPEVLEGHRGVIANPNCSTIQLVVALSPLASLAPLKRVVVATYQSVSGTGREAVEELRLQTRAVLEGKQAVPQVYPRPIAFNLLPHIDAFSADGYTKEERKLVTETRKIMGRPDLAISATTVRVPVEVGHSEAVWVETERPVEPETYREALAQAPGVLVMDDPGRGVYPTPLDAAGRDEVLVGRIRRDPSVASGLVFWVVADNLRKGAATNAVQIAEELLTRGLL